jgi:hypothetical protein
VDVTGCVIEFTVAVVMLRGTVVAPPPARFSQDSNMISQNVTDGASYLRYLLQG